MFNMNDNNYIEDLKYGLILNDHITEMINRSMNNMYVNIQLNKSKYKSKKQILEFIYFLFRQNYILNRSTSLSKMVDEVEEQLNGLDKISEVYILLLNKTKYGVINRNCISIEITIRHLSDFRIITFNKKVCND